MLNAFLIGVEDSKERRRGLDNCVNLEEAEFAVGLYMFLRLQGVRKEYITLLTTSPAQKKLIKEILRKKCGWHESFGLPNLVTTFSDFKDNSNSVVIGSLCYSSLDAFENIGNQFQFIFSGFLVYFTLKIRVDF